jgi:hypothetical protein
MGVAFEINARIEVRTWGNGESSVCTGALAVERGEGGHARQRPGRSLGRALALLPVAHGIDAQPDLYGEGGKRSLTVNLA